ncbi:MAG: BamA/TamA family outer membrane protein, partial [Methylocella sp.]
GQFGRGVEFNFTEPYFLGDRIAAGFDVYAKQSDAFQFSFVNNFVAGTTLRLGLPITEELTFSPRYSIYRTDMSVPNNSAQPFNDCDSPIFGITPGFGTGYPPSFFNNCLTNGEASLALKQAQGPFVTSMFGYTLGYNTLDNNKNPTGGFFAELKQDAAGAGGDERFVRTTADLRYYHELYEQGNIVGIVHLQGGDLAAFGGSQLRIVDNFNLGPTLVRGFAPFGIGPRDIGTGDPEGNPLGGTKYFGGSLEVQFPLYGLPRDLGLKGAIFADAGTLFGFTGRTNFSLNGVCTGGPFVPPFTQSNCITVGGDTTRLRTSAGGSIIWASPLGPIRFDFAKVITKSQFDQTQFFQFTGGTTF